MATDIKISQMPNATSLEGTELIPIVQGGTNKTTTPNKIKEGLATVAQLNNKVDKDGSKVLSDQNFTTTLKNKLDGIEAQANKYEHPANHPASMITEDETHKFVTDTEKATWNNKADSEDIPDISNLATKQELNSKQDTLTSGTNIKTINGQSLLGEGNIEIQGGSGGGISDAPSDGKKYVRQNAEWVEETSVDTSSLATKTELNTKANKVSTENVSEATKELQPNKYYIFGEVTTLTITLAAGEKNILAEYMFEFTSGTTPTTLTDIDGVEWKGDTIEANKVYQASISRGIGILIGRAKA